MEFKRTSCRGFLLGFTLAKASRGLSTEVCDDCFARRIPCLAFEFHLGTAGFFKLGDFFLF